MSKTVKILSIIMLVLMVCTFAIPTISNAADADKINPGDLTPEYVNMNDFKQKAEKVMGSIRNISVIAGVIVLMIIGVKYMLGSVEEKAEYKKTFMPYIVGVLLVMGATTVASFVFNIIA